MLVYHWLPWVQLCLLLLSTQIQSLHTQVWLHCPTIRNVQVCGFYIRVGSHRDQNFSGKSDSLQCDNGFLAQYCSGFSHLPCSKQGSYRSQIERCARHCPRTRGSHCKFLLSQDSKCNQLGNWCYLWETFRLLQHQVCFSWTFVKHTRNLFLVGSLDHLGTPDHGHPWRNRWYLQFL